MNRKFVLRIIVVCALIAWFKIIWLDRPREPEVIYPEPVVTIEVYHTHTEVWQGDALLGKYRFRDYYGRGLTDFQELQSCYDPDDNLASCVAAYWQYGGEW